MAEENARVQKKVDGIISQWHPAPSREVRAALLPLALYIGKDYAWCATDDVTATRIIDIIYEIELRAHPDGVVQYKDGEFAYVEEFKYPVVGRLQKILGLAAKMFEFAVEQGPPRDLPTVLNLLRHEHATVTARKATCRSSVEKEKNDEGVAWLKEGGRVVMDISQRYAMKGKAAEFLDSYGAYFQQPKPAPDKAHVNFVNATFEVCRIGSAKDRMKKVAKSPSNNCYFGIPTSLD